MNRELSKPTTQVQEVLYLLIKKTEMTRMDFMNVAYVQNAPACIHDLRHKHNVQIATTDITTTNRFGRTATYCSYSLKMPLIAIQQYEAIVNKDLIRKPNVSERE